MNFHPLSIPKKTRCELWILCDTHHFLRVSNQSSSWDLCCCAGQPWRTESHADKASTQTPSFASPNSLFDAFTASLSLWLTS